MTDENKLIRWIWERRLTTTYGAKEAISLIETIREEAISEDEGEKIKELWDELQEDFNIKNVGKEFICMECKSVFHAGSMFAKCCGKEVGVKLEEFSPEKHGKSLVGLSNSWISIDKRINEKWEKHPIYQEVWRRNMNDGYFGAAGIFIQFVEELINKLEDNE